MPPSHHHTNTESREAPSLDLHRMDNVQAAQLPPNNENFQRETTESREASSLELPRTDNVRQANCPWNLKIFKAKLERAEKPFSLVIGGLNFLLLLFHIAAHTVLFAEARRKEKCLSFLFIKRSTRTDDMPDDQSTYPSDLPTYWCTQSSTAQKNPEQCEVTKILYCHLLWKHLLDSKSTS